MFNSIHSSTTSRQLLPTTKNRWVSFSATKETALALGLCFYLTFNIALPPATIAAEPATPSPLALDPAHVTAAKRLMKAFGIEEAFGTLTTLMLQQIEAGLTARAQTDPKFTPERRTELLEKIKELKVIMPQRIDFPKILTEVTTETFAKCFTVKELDEMSAFYENPIGQRFGKEFSQNYQESFQLIMKGIEPKIDAAFEQAAMEILGPPPAETATPTEKPPSTPATKPEPSKK